MNRPMRALAARTGLAVLLTLGLAGSPFASDIPPEIAQQIGPGISQDELRSQLGEPTKQDRHLFSSGETWFYYLSDSSPGAERLVQINFDPQGVVQSTFVVDARPFSLDRFPANDTN